MCASRKRQRRARAHASAARLVHRNSAERVDPAVEHRRTSQGYSENSMYWGGTCSVSHTPFADT
jgi:hypothetical protein